MRILHGSLVPVTLQIKDKRAPGFGPDFVWLVHVSEVITRARTGAPLISKRSREENQTKSGANLPRQPARNPLIFAVFAKCPGFPCAGGPRGRAEMSSLRLDQGSNLKDS